MSHNPGPPHPARPDARIPSTLTLKKAATSAWLAQAATSWAAGGGGE